MLVICFFKHIHSIFYKINYNFNRIWIDISSYVFRLQFQTSWMFYYGKKFPSGRAFFRLFTGLETDDGEDFIHLNILYVSCACNTVQLIIKDLNVIDKYFRELVKIMKIIPSRIIIFTSSFKKQQINELGIRFYPPVQSQRWNSVYLTLNYIVNRLEGICKVFEPDDVWFINSNGFI